MPPSGEHQKTARVKYLSLVRDHTEFAAGNALSIILLRRAKAIDTLNNAILIVTGAMLTLAISQAHGALEVLSVGSFKVMILLLLISGMFGFVSKGAFTVSDIYKSLHIEMFDSLGKILDNHEVETKDDFDNAIRDGIDVEMFCARTEPVLTAFIKTLPESLRRRFTPRIEGRATEGYSSAFLVSAWKFAVSQVIAFVFQVFIFSLVFIVAVLGLPGK